MVVVVVAGGERESRSGSGECEKGGGALLGKIKMLVVVMVVLGKTTG